jgi:hypothetical protein
MDEDATVHVMVMAFIPRVGGGDVRTSYRSLSSDMSVQNADARRTSTTNAVSENVDGRSNVENYSRREILARSIGIGLLPLTFGVVLFDPQVASSAVPETIVALPSSDVSQVPSLSSSSILSSQSGTSSVKGDDRAGRSRCTDIESCREVGEQKVQQDLQDNPVTRLPNGVRYKKLKAGVGSERVEEDDVVDIIYSISRANGSYMYSVGFGYNKVDGMISGMASSDEGIESYRVVLGRKELPVGVESALIGSKKGERRRIEVPPAVGFETSNWKPEPTTRRGKAQIADYQSILKGRGTAQPPFAAPLIWDVEVLGFRKK